MNIDPVYLIERKKHKSLINKLKLGIVLVSLAFCAILLQQDQMSFLKDANISDYIAVIKIDKVILEDSIRDKAIEKVRKDDKAKAVILTINSPGGTVTGSEKVYHLLKDIAKQKPVVCLMEGMAASGGYMIALASDYIIAHNTTITGSIGVVRQMPEITDALEKLGITYHAFKSNKLKASPNPFEKLTDDVKEVAMESILDIYDFFVDLVVSNRKISKPDAIKIADGRIYTGRQAYKYHLIDQIGTFDDAKKWLYDVKKIDKEIKLVEVDLEENPSITKKMFLPLRNQLLNLLSFAQNTASQFFFF